MKLQPAVYILCGVHNDLDSTKRLLTCIHSQSYLSLRTIMIDDGSTDGTGKYIKKNYPEITLITGNGNLWWTGSLFLGVEKVLKDAKPGDFMLTINNDCEIERDFISILTKTSIDNDRSIVGSLAVDVKNKNRIWDAGVQIDWQKGKFIALGPYYMKDLPKDKTIQDQIDTLTTKGTLYPIEVFRKIGNFDKEHLPHYVSDYEFACRAKRAGFSLLLSLRARVYNDTKRTGFGGGIFKEIRWGNFFKLLFYRRSKINLVDHFWFITLCCPNQYKVKNYFLLAAKFVYLFSFLLPFVFFRQIISLIKKYL